jgi:hypothetical protein
MSLGGVESEKADCIVSKQTRANLEDRYVNWAKEQGFESFVGWFEFWLKGD